MRIVMITQWFYPEPGTRVHELAEELVRRGHAVTVIAGQSRSFSPHSNRSRGCLFCRENQNGINVLRVVKFFDEKKSTLQRIGQYVLFSMFATIAGIVVGAKHQCMYVFLPPPLLGLSASVIGYVHNIPFVYDIQDIWPDAGVATGLTKKKWFILTLRLLEKVVYPLSEMISVPSKGYKKNLTRKGVDPSRIVVIPNWADEGVYHNMPYDKEFAIQNGLENCFIVTFAGNLGFSQALDTVVEAARLLSSEKRIKIVLAGDGVAMNSLQEKAKQYRLNNIVFLGRLPIEKMPCVYSISDILLVHLKNEPIFKITIPSKTQAYMASAKPILMANEGDSAELINSTESGFVCRQESPMHLADSVLSAYRLPKGELKKMGLNARDVYLKRFRKTIVVDQFEGLFYRIKN